MVITTQPTAAELDKAANKAKRAARKVWLAEHNARAAALKAARDAAVLALAKHIAEFGEDGFECA